jgi:sugar lactone lactonase YvrE
MNFYYRYKKIIWLVIFILAIFFIAYLLYVIFFNQVVSTPPDQDGTGVSINTGSLPQAGTGPGGQIIDQKIKEKLPNTGIINNDKIDTIARGGVTKITDLNQTPSMGVTLGKNGSDLQYYNKTDGKFYRLNSQGEISLLADIFFPEVKNVIWSPIKNKAIIEFPDGANIIYNFDTKEQITMPQHWKDFNFSPDGGQIVMKSMGIDPDNRWLAITSEDGTKTRAIESLGDKDETVYPSWSPNNQTVAMFTEGIDFDRQNVFFVGLNQENFKSMVVDGRGFQSQWSPQGDKLLYSVYSSQNNLKPSLWLTNAQGDQIGANRQPLNIETWANKCTFADSSTVYCAVPESLEEGSGLMPELADNTTDQLYKIDLKSGIKSLVATPDNSYNISSLLISADDSIIYFTDRTNQTIHQVKLK